MSSGRPVSVRLAAPLSSAGPHQRPPALQDCSELCPGPQVLDGRDLGPYPSPSSPR
jgi:hypothetical protein